MNLKRRFADRNRDFSKVDDCGNKVCRFCRKPLATGVYCSEKCHTEVDVRCGWNHERHIRERDGGICLDCGIDTHELDEALMVLQRKLKHGRWYYMCGHGFSLFAEIAQQCGLTGETKTTENFHHVISVEDGGGCCGLDNYATLCIRCHKKRHASKKKKEVEG